MRNIKITIEFDGTNYNGWQIQPGRPTIQGEIERALNKLVQQEIKIIGAGRTDTGVHALNQVANFLTESQLPLIVFQKGLNRFLPLDIRILKVEAVPLAFNARYDAKYRKYRYHLSTRKRAINRLYSSYCKYPLNFTVMQAAIPYLMGKHDFRSFCKLNTALKNFDCEIFSIILRQLADEIVLEIVANRFLHHTVRIIMGTLIDIGRERRPPHLMYDILQARDRKMAGKTAPPQGLFLVEVGYQDFKM